MKLWLLSQTKNEQFDTYDKAVVAAETESEARFIHPDEYSVTPPGDDATDEAYGTWTCAENVNVKFLGEAAPGTSKGVILASYNGG